MVFPTLVAWAYFVALARPTVGADPEANRALQATYSLGKIVQFSFPILYLAYYDRRRLRPGGPHFRGLVPALVFGVLVGIGILALYHFALRDWLLRVGTAAKVREKVAEFGAATPAGFCFLAAFLSVAHSLLEEYYWRWFVFGELQRHVRVGLAITLSSVAFTAHHVIVLYVYLPAAFLEAVVPFSLAIAAGGAVWAWLYHRYGSIYSPWLSHLVVDCAIMAVGYHLVFTG